MSLNFNFTDIENFEEVCYLRFPEVPLTEERINPVTETLIYYSMFTDIGWQITSKNVDEFFKRIKLHEALFGPILGGPEGPRPITREQVDAHVGLRVNVAPVTRGRWQKRMVDEFMRKA
jgi:hypothetical protein